MTCSRVPDRNGMRVAPRRLTRTCDPGNLLVSMKDGAVRGERRRQANIHVVNHPARLSCCRCTRVGLAASHEAVQPGPAVGTEGDNWRRRAGRVADRDLGLNEVRVELA